ncbi:MAG: PA14 domain-containing protein [Planctomycetota bacterium]
MCRKLIYLVSFVLVLGLVGVASGTEGLRGEYYHGGAGNLWRDLIMVRIDPTIDFSWGDGSPDPSMNVDGFTVRWTGMIEVPASAAYTFHSQTDDGIRLYVNGELIINNWTDHANTHDSGDISLKAGQKYEIILEWYENGGGAICELSWESSTIAREAIPSQYLSVERPFPRNPEPADGAVLRDTWVSFTWASGDYAVSHDVYLGENYDDVAAGTGDTFQGNQTDNYFTIGFPGFPYPDGLVPGMTYYWRIVEVDESNPESPWEGSVWSFSIAPKSAFSPDPVDGSESVDPNVALSWEPGIGTILHYVYFGDDYDVVDNAAGSMPWGTLTYSPGTLDLEKVYYWRVDAFHGVETFKGDIWSFSTPGAVGSPMPSNGAVDVTQVQILSWAASDSAASHQVYFGTDKDAVRSADTGSPEYKGSKNLGSESYDPGKLEWDTTYYWRVDEVKADSTSQKGMVWSFTTANFLIVDDFESYNDLDPADPASNRIFNVWLDGFDDQTNGSLVGYDTAPFAEQNIVHSGSQSMPMSYDNAVGKSEVTLTLTYPRDWTEKGVTTLTIWYIGDAANAAEPLYVALNGSAVVSHDNPDAAQITTWTQWDIDLQAFADQGVNLANVNTIALGLGNRNNPLAGGSGTMYIDDIRLYPPPPEPAP